MQPRQRGLDAAGVADRANTVEQGALADRTAVAVRLVCPAPRNTVRRLQENAGELAAPVTV